MKYKNVKIFFLSLITLPLFAENLFLIDKIETIIYGPQETSIITKSDLERIGFDGQPRTKDKLIFENLVFQDAKKYNILDEKLVDRYIEAVQREHNISLEQLKEMFRSHGYTYEEGREQLAMFNTINQLLDFKIRSKVIIPESEAREYYNANPVYQEEAYSLQRIFVPIAPEQKEQEVKNKINTQIKIGQKITGAEYTDPFWVEKPDLAEDKSFIKNMSAGQISSPKKHEGGFELFKLVERRERQLIPFEKRYVEILNKLRKPLYEKLFSDYKENLFKESVIIHLS